MGSLDHIFDRLQLVEVDKFGAVVSDLLPRLLSHVELYKSQPLFFRVLNFIAARIKDNIAIRIQLDDLLPLVSVFKPSLCSNLALNFIDTTLDRASSTDVHFVTTVVLQLLLKVTEFPLFSFSQNVILFMFLKKLSYFSNNPTTERFIELLGGNLFRSRLELIIDIFLDIMFLQQPILTRNAAGCVQSGHCIASIDRIMCRMDSWTLNDIKRTKDEILAFLSLQLDLILPNPSNFSCIIFKTSCNCFASSCKYRIGAAVHVIGRLDMIVLPLLAAISESSVNLFKLTKMEVSMQQRIGAISSSVLNSYDMLERVGSFVSCLVSSSFSPTIIRDCNFCCSNYQEVVRMLAAIMKLVQSSTFIDSVSDIRHRRTLVSSNCILACLLWLSKHLLPFSLAHIATSSSLKGIISSCFLMLNKCGQHDEFFVQFESSLVLISSVLFMSSLASNKKITIMSLDDWSKHHLMRIEYDSNLINVGSVAESFQLVSFKLFGSVLAQLNQVKHITAIHCQTACHVARSAFLAVIHYFATNASVPSLTATARPSNFSLKHQKRNKKDLTAISSGDEVSSLEVKDDVDVDSETIRHVAYWILAFLCSNYDMLNESHEVLIDLFCKLGVLLTNLTLFESDLFLGRLSECHSLVIHAITLMMKKNIMPSASSVTNVSRLVSLVHQLCTIDMSSSVISSVVDFASDNYSSNLFQQPQSSANSTNSASTRKAIGFTWCCSILPQLPDYITDNGTISPSSVSVLISFLQVLHEKQSKSTESRYMVQFLQLTNNRSRDALYEAITGIKYDNSSIIATSHFTKWVPLTKLLCCAFTDDEFNRAFEWYLRYAICSMSVADELQSSCVELLAISALDFLSDCDLTRHKREASLCFHLLSVCLHCRLFANTSQYDIAFRRLECILCVEGSLIKVLRLDPNSIGLLIFEILKRSINQSLLADIKLSVHILIAQDTFPSNLWLITSYHLSESVSEEEMNYFFDSISDQVISKTKDSFDLVKCCLVALIVFSSENPARHKYLSRFVLLICRLQGLIESRITWSDCLLSEFQLMVCLQSLVVLFWGNFEVIRPSNALVLTSIEKVVALCPSWEDSFLIGNSISLFFQSLNSLQSDQDFDQIKSNFLRSVLPDQASGHSYGVLLSMVRNSSITAQSNGIFEIFENQQDRGRAIFLDLEDKFQNECSRLVSDSAKPDLIWILSSCLSLFNCTENVDSWKQDVEFMKFGVFSTFPSLSASKGEATLGLSLYHGIFKFITEIRSVQQYSRLVSFKNDLLLSTVVCLSCIYPSDKNNFPIESVLPSNYLMQLRNSNSVLCGLCFLNTRIKSEPDSNPQTIDVGVKRLYEAVCNASGCSGKFAESQLLFEHSDFILRYAVEVKAQHGSWRERLVCCHFLQHALDVWSYGAVCDSMFQMREYDEGKMCQLLSVLLPSLENLWRTAFHLIDDIRDVVRVAAESVLVPQLMRLCRIVLECNIPSLASKISDFGSIIVSPILFEIGFRQKSDAVYSASVSLLLLLMTSNEYLGIGKFHLEEHFAETIDILMTLNPNSEPAVGGNRKREHSRVDGPKILLLIIDEISVGISKNTFKESVSIFTKLLSLTRNFAMDAIFGISPSSMRPVSSSTEMLSMLFSGVANITRKSLRSVLENASRDSQLWNDLRLALINLLNAVFYKCQHTASSFSSSMKFRRECCDIFATIMKTSIAFGDIVSTEPAFVDIVFWCCSYPLSLVNSELHNSTGISQNLNYQSDIDGNRLEVSILALTAILEPCAASRRLFVHCSEDLLKSFDGSLISVLVLLFSLKEFRQKLIASSSSLTNSAISGFDDEGEVAVGVHDVQESIKLSCSTLFTLLNSSLFRHDISIAELGFNLNLITDVLSKLLSSRNWTARVMGACAVHEIFGTASSNNYLYRLFHHPSNGSLDEEKKLQSAAVCKIALMLIHLSSEGFNWNGYEFSLRAIVTVVVSPYRFLFLLYDFDNYWLSRNSINASATIELVQDVGMLEFNVAGLLSLLIDRSASRSTTNRSQLLLSAILLISQFDQSVSVSWGIDRLERVWLARQDEYERSKSVIPLKIHLITAYIIKCQCDDLKSFYLPTMKRMFEAIVNFGVSVDVIESNQIVLSSILYYCDKLFDKICGTIVKTGDTSEFACDCFVHILNGCETIVACFTAFKFKHTFHGTLVSFLVSASNRSFQVINHQVGFMQPRLVELRSLIRKFVMDIRLLIELVQVSNNNFKQELQSSILTFESIEIS